MSNVSTFIAIIQLNALALRKIFFFFATASILKAIDVILKYNCFKV